MFARLRKQLAPGRAYVAVVSDHGFAKTDAQLNLFPLFRQAKLFTTDDKGKISDWRAMPWGAERLGGHYAERSR